MRSQTRISMAESTGLAFFEKKIQELIWSEVSVGAAQLVLPQIDARLALIVLTLWVSELFILCSVLLAERKRRQLAKKIEGILAIVQTLKRSEETRSLRQAADTRYARKG